jgi:hypothetical protein
MALTATMNKKFLTQFTGPLDLSTPIDELNLDRSIVFTNGTGANQANMIFHDQRTLADAANEVLDLYASGTLKDPLGTVLTMAKLKFLFIKNGSADANLLIGGATTPVGLFNVATDVLKLPPGGQFEWTAPNAAGLDLSTNKNLKLAHDGTGSSTLTYDIIAIGID